MSEVLDLVISTWESFPGAAQAALVLVLGWLAALAIRFLVGNAFRIIRFDTLSAKTGLSEFLRKGKVKYSPSSLVGVFAYWIALLAAFLQVAKILDRGIYETIAQRIAGALPNVASALLVAIVGYLIVSFIANFVLTIALNASLANARLLSRALKGLGIIIVVTMALEQIGLGQSIIEYIFQIVLAAAALAAALAFGLGCKDLAKDAYQRLIRNLRERDRGSRGGDLEG
jgi:hypothetical protein